MNDDYDILPPPPDGYGPWHKHIAGPDDDPPEGVGWDTPCYVLLNEDVGLSGAYPRRGYATGWDWSNGVASSDTISYFCLREDHPFNHTIPEPTKPTLDMTGMDEHELWGSF